MPYLPIYLLTYNLPTYVLPMPYLPIYLFTYNLLTYALPTYLPTYLPSIYLCHTCLLLSTYYLPKLPIYLPTYQYFIYLSTYLISLKEKHVFSTTLCD